MNLKSLVKAAALATLAMLPFTSQAQLVLDPLLGQNGAFVLNVCDIDPATPALTCPAPGVLNGPTNFTVTFLNAGTMGSGGLTSVQLVGTGSFTVFNYQVFNETLDPGHTTVLATGTPQAPPNLSVLANVYTFVVNWQLTSTNVSSATWAVGVTTSPPLRVPEPTTLALVAIALLGLGTLSLRRRG